MRSGFSRRSGWPSWGERVERLLAAPELQRERLRRGHAEHLARARQNRRLLAKFASEHLPGVMPADEGVEAWVA